MVEIDKRVSKTNGFTIIELLVTLVIIGIVLGMLLPAFTAVQKAANEVRQKSQFSNIEVALESFRSDFGDYPESRTANPADPVEGYYSGAQKLAEAIVGQDGFGAHIKTRLSIYGTGDYNGDGAFDNPEEYLYGILAGNSFEGPGQNKAARRGPYLELESANVIKVSAMYSSQAVVEDTLLLADMFGLAKNAHTSSKTGLPVLYYKADTTSIMHASDAAWTWADYDQNIYSIMDNWLVLSDLTPPFKDGRANPLADIANASDFYDMTRNPNFVGSTPRPYRAESFILHSAGPDGVYGSPDDVFNFDPDN